MPTIIAFYSESNQNDQWNLISTTAIAYSQAFTAISTYTILDSAKWYLKKSGSPVGNIVAKIYNTTGTFNSNCIPTGAALATSDNVDVSTLATSFGLVTFSFSGANRITLTPTSHYALSVEYTGDASNYVAVGEDASPTQDGNFGAFASGSWVSFIGYEACFYVYGVQPTSYEWYIDLV